jgi:hypothetical protein
VGKNSGYTLEGVFDSWVPDNTIIPDDTPSFPLE